MEVRGGKPVFGSWCENNHYFGSSIVAWWLGFHFLIAMAWVQALVRELRSCKLQGLARKKKKRERINATLHIQQLAFPEGRSSQSWLSIGTTWELSAILLPGFHPRPISQSLQGWILNISFFFFFFFLHTISFFWDSLLLLCISKSVPSVA